MEDKILKLTKLWYEYIGKDHHKDRDCHWWIIKIWSYGEKPYYQIRHDGYIFTAHNNRKYKTCESAEKALYREIEKAFKNELKWSHTVINYEKEYDRMQVDKAKWLIENYKEE